MRLLNAVSLLTALVTAAPGLPELLGKRDCPHDNLLRCLIASPSLAIPYCSSSGGVSNIDPSTALVTVTPTDSVTATATSTSTITETSTLTDSFIDTQTITAGSTTTILITSTSTALITERTTVTVNAGCGGMVDLPEKRGAGPTSLACISDLGYPSPSSVSHACSCFSGSYVATLEPVTLTLTAPAVTTTATTVTDIADVTVYIDVTVSVTATTTQTTTTTITVCSTVTVL